MSFRPPWLERKTSLPSADDPHAVFTSENKEETNQYPAYAPSATMQSVLQHITFLSHYLKNSHLNDEDRQRLLTEHAKWISYLAEDWQNRLPALSEGTPSCSSRRTRISTESPDSSHYKIFCNEKELKHYVFADERGGIAVCYQIANGELVYRTPDHTEVKTQVHYGKIEIRKVEE